jgi:hypothetical protein
MKAKLLRHVSLAFFLLVAQGCSTAPHVPGGSKASMKSEEEVAEGAFGHFLDFEAAPAIQGITTHRISK